MTLLERLQSAAKADGWTLPEPKSTDVKTFDGHVTFEDVTWWKPREAGMRPFVIAYETFMHKGIQITTGFVGEKPKVVKNGNKKRWLDDTAAAVRICELLGADALCAGKGAV